MVVDVNCRLHLAAGIHDYLNGKIDNFKLDDAIVALETDDPACIEISREVSRFLDDYSRHYYSQVQLSPDYEQGLRRWIAFLRTNDEWPFPVRSQGFFSKIASVFHRKEVTEFTRNPYWPFADEGAWKVYISE